MELNGIHLIHLNVNSLLLKIEEFRFIAECTNAAVTGITRNWKSKYITMIFFDVTEAETVEVLLAILEVILVKYGKTFFQM